MKLIIEQEVAQAIANYLQTKPYGEVYPFINALMQLPKLDEPPTEKPPEANGKTGPAIPSTL